MTPEEANKLRAIYIRYGKEMQYKALNLLRDPHDAQDVVQRAIEKIARNIHKLDRVESSKTRGYVLFTIQNLAYDVYRERGKIIEIDIRECDELESGNFLDDYFERFEEYSRWEQNMDGLKNAFVEILTLRYYYEYKVGEIAGILRISANNASKRLARAENAWRLKQVKERERRGLHERKNTVRARAGAGTGENLN